MSIILQRDEDHNTLGANHDKELEGVGVAVNISRLLLKTRLTDQGDRIWCSLFNL